MKKTFAAFIALSFGSAAAAQPYTIDSYTIDSGGGTISGSTYELSGTIGQADASAELTSATYELTGGFWHSSSVPTRLCADQNGDGIVSPADFSAWVANYNVLDLRADTNQDGSITPADFSAWVAAFNVGATGPLCSP